MELGEVSMAQDGSKYRVCWRLRDGGETKSTPYNFDTERLARDAANRASRRYLGVEYWIEPEPIRQREEAYDEIRHQMSG